MMKYKHIDKIDVFGKDVSVQKPNEWVGLLKIS